jgi:nicotinamide riboside transporter PnuC
MRERPEWVTAPPRRWVFVVGVVGVPAFVAILLLVTAGPATAAFGVVIGVVNGILSVRRYRRGLENGL